MSDDAPRDTTGDEREGLWTRLNRSRAFRWARDITLVVLVFLGLGWFQTRHLVPTGEPAPNFALLGLDGQTHQLENLKGKPTVVYFWATWCGVCEVSSDNVSKIRKAYGDEANVVSVVLDYASPDAVRSFVEKNDVTYPVFLGQRQTAADWAIEAFPTIYVLDAEGRVRHRTVGYTTQLGLRARLFLLSLI